MSTVTTVKHARYFRGTAWNNRSGSLISSSNVLWAYSSDQLRMVIAGIARSNNSGSVRKYSDMSTIEWRKKLFMKMLPLRSRNTEAKT